MVPGGAWDVCGAPGQQFYLFGRDPLTAADTLDNPNHPARQRQLIDFLQNVADGDYVALLSVNRIRWAGWGLLRSQAAVLLGSAQLLQVQNGDPLAVLGRKYAAGGRLVREAGPNPALPTPRYNQIIALTDTLRTRSTTGTVTSVRIGPAQQWNTLYNWISQASTTSRYALKVLGVDTLGVTHELPGFGNVTAGMRGLALGSIPARTYPYLQLSLSLADSLSRTAPQLREWFVTYRGLPEGLVRRDLVPAAAYAPATLVAQAEASGTVSFPVKFVNVTNVDFGTPLMAKVELLDPQGRAFKSALVPVPRPVRAYDTLTLNVPPINITGEFGTFRPRVTINPTTPGRPQPELYYFNNELLLPPFTVVDRNLPPVLDVAVDGRHILTGELVSPTPLIRVQLRDEDNLRRLADASAFTLLLKRPGQPRFELVDLAASNVRFALEPGVANGSIATLDYQPGLAAPLPDGVYTLRVQGRDASSATAAAAEFEVQFEVVNASTITNVFPYPNPVVGSARFVFTVTGQELPRNMKIQIMTLTGAVVKEIFMAELGPLHIGNNVTDYAWDGRDQYGDRLANGTYLYRVALDDPNGQFSRRQTAADRAFKNDWGKLVLMR